jgi:hypothetical protein
MRYEQRKNTVSELKKIHCNTCKRETNHELLATHNCDYDYEDGGWYEKTRYGFWVCKGCDTASLEDRYTHSGMHDYDGNEIYDFTYFPERNSSYLHIAKKFVHINKKLNAVYLEIIKAHNQGLEIISAIGIRALLEGICVEEGIDDNIAYGLNKKIKKLQEKNNIPENIIDGLNSLKFIGDSAAHRLDSSNNNSIMLSIDLLEALLIHLYEAKFELQRKAELVKKAHNKNIQPT